MCPLWELDTFPSRYFSETELQIEVSFIDTMAKALHQAGIKGVIYYLSMEIVAPNGETSSCSMAKDYPDWIQVGYDPVVVNANVVTFFFPHSLIGNPQALRMLFLSDNAALP